MRHSPVKLGWNLQGGGNTKWNSPKVGMSLGGTGKGVGLGAVCDCRAGLWESG